LFTTSLQPSRKSGLKTIRAACCWPDAGGGRQCRTTEAHGWWRAGRWRCGQPNTTRPLARHCERRVVLPPPLCEVSMRTHAHARQLKLREGGLGDRWVCGRRTRLGVGHPTAVTGCGLGGGFTAASGWGHPAAVTGLRPSPLPHPHARSLCVVGGEFTCLAAVTGPGVLVRVAGSRAASWWVHPMPTPSRRPSPPHPPLPTHTNTPAEPDPWAVALPGEGLHPLRRGSGATDESGCRFREGSTPPCPRGAQGFTDAECGGHGGLCVASPLKDHLLCSLHTPLHPPPSLPHSIPLPCLCVARRGSPLAL
jgi:hypothetical protein